MPPRMCSAARMRSVAMNRSATMPTKNGEIIAANAVVPAARPICSPEKWRVCPSHVPIVTYHAPHTKYCRNIIADSLTRTLGVMRSLRPPRLDRRFGEDDARQAVDRGAQAFVHRRERVLVLDAHHVVVAGEPQRADD